MAIEMKLVPDTPYEVASDLSSYQYYPVVINADGQIELASNVTKLNGILQDKPAVAGRAGAVQSTGISKVQLGGTVNEGDSLAVNSSNKVVAIDLAAASDRWLLGTSLTNGISGEVGSVELNINYLA